MFNNSRNIFKQPLSLISNSTLVITHTPSCIPSLTKYGHEGEGLGSSGLHLVTYYVLNNISGMCLRLKYVQVKTSVEQTHTCL